MRTTMCGRGGRVLVSGALLVAALAIHGCSGGGSAEVLPSTCMTFVPAGDPAPSTATARAGAGSTCDSAVVEIVLTDVTDVGAVSFDAIFDPALVSYLGYSLTDSHLSSDGAEVSILTDVGPGSVSLGVTRLSVPGIDFNGSGLVVRLLFGKAAGTSSGDSPLGFAETHVFGSEEGPVEKPGIVWSGGTLRIQ